MKKKMKNILLILGLAFTLMIAFSSCTKDYTCECNRIYTSANNSNNWPVGSSHPEHNWPVQEKNPSAAQTKCNTYSAADNGFFKIECEIK